MSWVVLCYSTLKILENEFNGYQEYTLNEKIWNFVVFIECNCIFSKLYHSNDATLQYTAQIKRVQWLILDFCISHNFQISSVPYISSCFFFQSKFQVYELNVGQI